MKNFFTLLNSYMVDMTMGICSCETGKDDSPSKHQYLIWVAKLANCLNFVPNCCPELWQTLALVALDETLPVSKYTLLRDVDPSDFLLENGVEAVDKVIAVVETTVVEPSIIHIEKI